VAENGYKRRLAAILSADAVGYSRLMGSDEAYTIRTITECRQIFKSHIHEHDGRVVDSPGDNILGEFSSVINAVNSAINIQKELKAKNEGISEDRRMLFRIGIHLGDVIQEGKRIYGDGVNIAARIEGLAEEGGICISGSVYDQIKGKIHLSYESLGEQSLKNIENPIRIYRIVEESSFSFQMNREFKLPDKPSIAVLPFTNMSGNPEQEYFSDGLTEEIITGLSKLPQLLVIARNSSFTYKNKPVRIQQVSRELGVKYVLEGSVRSAGERLRVTAQLIDGTTGQHLWSERYDRPMADIFSVQDDITLQIVVAMRVNLTEGEQARLQVKHTDNLEAYFELLKASEYFKKFDKFNNILARQSYERAITIYPEYAVAYSALAFTYLLDAWVGWTENPQQAIKKAFEYSRKSLTIDDTDAWAHATMGICCLLSRQWEKAVKAGDLSTTLCPNSADILGLFCITLRSVGRVDEALFMIEKAIRLNPMPPEWYLHELATCFRLLGQYEKAIMILKENLNRNPDYIMSRINLTATYSMAGDMDKARRQAKEVLELYPNFSAGRFMKGFPYKDKKIIDDFVENLRKAGLPV